jgi:hypothetical protein
MTRWLAVAVAQHGDAHRQPVEDPGHPAVVGAEVMPPVRDAVGLVDDQHPHPVDHVGEDVGPEAGVVEPLGGDEEEVDVAGAHPLLDGVPVVAVLGVDGGGPHPGPLRHLQLVAHEGEQRRDEEGGAGAGVAQQPGGDEVHGALAPPRALDDEGPAPIGDHSPDGLELAGAEGGVVPAGKAGEERAGLVVDDLGDGRGGHRRRAYGTGGTSGFRRRPVAGGGSDAT